MDCLIHIDGGARGNPGPAAAGVTITTPDGSEPLYEAGFWLGTSTNNEAEYQGLLHALKAATRLGCTALTIRSDSELMVKQVLGKYRVKAANLKPLYQEAVQLLAGFAKWEIGHVRREGNKRADQLANLAMDARADVIAFDSLADEA
ncbi:MAG: ribonuclease HI family protein [Phycisphaerales bacterium JB063]